MSAHRAFRFLGLRTGEGNGLALTATGAVSMVDGDESIRQAILMLLATTPGERLMRPEYGSYLYRLVFTPNDHTTAGLAIHYVRQAVLRWEPRVEIVDVDAEADPQLESQLNVRLQYRVRATLTTGTVDVLVNLSPPGGLS